MEREDAIKTLKELWRETNDPWYEEVYNMAINALETDRKTENCSEKPNNCEPQKDCNDCKFVGTYDTEFPCANCSRKTKDYYAKTEPQEEEFEEPNYYDPALWE